MTGNLLLWKWSEDYETPAKRKKQAVKFGQITSQFAITGDHPAIGQANIAAFREALVKEFGSDENERPFVVEDYDKCVVINYPNAVRFDIVAKVADIGRRFGLNASEF